MEAYIEDKKSLYTSIYEFLEESEEHNDDEYRKKLFEKIIKNQNIKDASEGMRQFLEIIKSIGEYHHRDQHFDERMNELLLHFRDQIKQTLSNQEIFHFFENNKKIVLFLLKKDIITISREIYNEIEDKVENNGNRYCHFFIPELGKIINRRRMRYIKNELLEENPNFFTNYEKKREEGENDSYICSLIRQDSVKEFIEYVNRYKISPLSEISPSIFETNKFLIDNKNISLIEYSAFFGSIQIFRYLLMNNAKITPSLWLYAIHSKNAELIHLLESIEVPPPKSKNKQSSSQNNYEQCLIESIKCHHNDIANYFENNFINQNEKDSQLKEEIISSCIKYHNYTFFQKDIIFDHGFFYLCLYHWDKLINLLLKDKSFEEKVIQYPTIYKAMENNDVKVIYYYLLKMKEIPLMFFESAKITQISIPPSVTSIGAHAFYRCYSLAQISISSSVKSIGEDAFYGCKSLTQISIPSSVTSIEYDAFCKCFSLVQITFEIPSSLTSIGDCAFFYCKSLTQISIPSSVTSIGNCAFEGCLSLTQITIPSSVTSIGDSAFSGCSSLTHISIPSRIDIKKLKLDPSIIIETV